MAPPLGSHSTPRPPSTCSLEANTHGRIDSGHLAPLSPSCFLPLASLSPFWRFLAPVSPLLLACCFPVALPLLPGRSPVASLLLSCRPPVPILSLPMIFCRFLLPCYFFRSAFLSLSCPSPVVSSCHSPVTISCCLSVALLSLACRLPVASLLPPCVLPVVSCCPTWYPVALLLVASRLPVACLSLSCSLPVASLSPPCPPTCYPIAPLLHSCGLPVAFMSAACRLPVASLSLACRLPVAFLALFGLRKKETLPLLRSFPFALRSTVLWLPSISIIAASFLDLPFIYANGMVWL